MRKEISEEIENCIKFKNEKLDLSFSKLNGSEKELDLLKYCDHVKTIDLSFNNLLTLSKLKNLKNIEVIILDGNKINNVSDLSSLKNLKMISLNLKYLKVPPYWFAYLDLREQMPTFSDLYLKLPKAEEIWQLLKNDKFLLAKKTALKNNWSKTDFLMYKRLLNKIY